MRMPSLRASAVPLPSASRAVRLPAVEIALDRLAGGARGAAAQGVVDVPGSAGIEQVAEDEDAVAEGVGRAVAVGVEVGRRLYCQHEGVAGR